jgi:lipopolysaccharide transport system permease protein
LGRPSPLESSEESAVQLTCRWDVARGSAAELWQYRELFWFLVWRDITVRYKQTVFGVAWALIQPLVGMLVLTQVFGGLVGTTSLSVPYGVFAYSGLVLWVYFSSALNQAGNSLVLNSKLITKVYFPRVLLPAASATSGLLDLLIGSVFLLVLVAYYGIPLTWTAFLYPVLVFALWLFTLGAAMGLAAANVRYRDVKHAIPFLVQIGLFVTPVVYPTSLMSHRLRQLSMLNPLAGLLEAFRACLFPQQGADMKLIASSFAVGAVVFVVGGLYFRSTERAFADVV